MHSSPVKSAGSNMQYPIQVVEISVQILGHQCSSSLKSADSIYSRVDFYNAEQPYIGVALPTIFNNFETFCEKLTPTREWYSP